MTHPPAKVERTEAQILQDAGRERHLQEYLRETDRTAVEQLQQRYQGVASPERLRALGDLPTRFEGPGEFDRNRRLAGIKEPREGTAVVGFWAGSGEAAHVSTEQPQATKTVFHERLHQLSDPEAIRQLGKPLYEGMTEDMAIREVGSEPPTGLGRSYALERGYAQELRKVAGDRAVEKAYFQGDFTELRARVEQKMGPGSLDLMREAVEQLSDLGL